MTELTANSTSMRSSSSLSGWEPKLSAQARAASANNLSCSSNTQHLLKTIDKNKIEINLIFQWCGPILLWTAPLFAALNFPPPNLIVE
jgi:hypothetical protein